MRWYVMSGTETVGPVEAEEIVECARVGTLIKGMFVRDEAGGAWMPVEQSPFAKGVRDLDAEAAAARRVAAEKRSAKLVGGCLVVFVAGAILYMLIGSRSVHTSTTPVPGWEPPRPPAVAQPEMPRVPTVTERLSATSDLRSAISVMRVSFEDSENRLDPASAVFSVWSTLHMKWADLQAIPETKRALVMKDSSAERGKRLCWSGSVAEISTDRSAGAPIYGGAIVNDNLDVVRFAAVGYSGEIVEHSYARVCGIVTGIQSYSNAGGGTTHAAYVVGMFDLPENKIMASH